MRQINKIICGKRCIKRGKTTDQPLYSLDTSKANNDRNNINKTDKILGVK